MGRGMRYEGPRTAIVVIDMINWMFGWRGGTLNDSDAEFRATMENLVIPNNRRLIDAGRAAGMPIAYSRLAARNKDYSDIPPGLREIVRSAGALEGTHASALVGELTVEPGDLDIVKFGSGAYTSSDLSERLHDLGVKRVFYTGVLTQACVALTAMSGLDMGFDGFVITDAVGSRTPADHQRGLAGIGQYATKITTHEALTLAKI